jgi:hypothetical protein
MSYRPVPACLTLVLTLVACEPDQVSNPANAHRHPSPEPANVEVSARSVAADLTELKQATASFHDFAAADSAGWRTPITECMSSLDGGMGFHYAKVGLLDAVVDAAEPEALLYEPDRNGKLRLVGVEYIVPRGLWTEADGVTPRADPPELFGQQYSYVAQFDVYGLHAWVWRNNPNGMFAPWNPDVSCAFAPAN